MRLGTLLLACADPSRATVWIRGRGVTVKGFRITGGYEGVFVDRGTATVEDNAIHAVGESGVHLRQNAFAQVSANTISSNGDGLYSV